LPQQRKAQVEERRREAKACQMLQVLHMGISMCPTKQLVKQQEEPQPKLQVEQEEKPQVQIKTNHEDDGDLMMKNKKQEEVEKQEKEQCIQG
jgi:hypothetical protein